jgi:hypothetical protein
LAYRDAYLQPSQPYYKEESKMRRVSSSSVIPSTTPPAKTASSHSIDITKYRELVDSGQLLENYNGEVTTFIASQAQTIEAYLKRLKDSSSRQRYSDSATSRSQSVLGSYTDRSETSLVADLREQVALYKEQIRMLSSTTRPQRATAHVTPKRKAELEEVNEMFATNEVQLAADKWKEAEYLEFDGESSARSLECLRQVVQLRDSQLIEADLQLKDACLWLEKFQVELQAKDSELMTLQKSLVGSPLKNVHAEYQVDALHDRVEFLTKTLDTREATITDLLKDCRALQQLKAKFETKLKILENEVKMSQGAESDRVKHLSDVVRIKDDEISKLFEQVRMLEGGIEDFKCEELHQECAQLRAIVNEKELAIQELKGRGYAAKPAQVNSRYAGLRSSREDTTGQLEKQLGEVTERLRMSERCLSARNSEVGALARELDRLQTEQGRQTKLKLIPVPNYSESSGVPFSSQSAPLLEAKATDCDKNELTKLRAALERSQANSAMLEDQLKEAKQRVALLNSSYSEIGRLSVKDSPATPSIVDYSARPRLGLTMHEQSLPSSAGLHQPGKNDPVAAQQVLAPAYTLQEVDDIKEDSAGLELRNYKEAVRTTQLLEKNSQVAQLFDSVERLTQMLRDTDEKEEISTLKAEINELYGKLDAKDHDISENYVLKDWVEELLVTIEPAEIDLIEDFDRTNYNARIKQAIARVRITAEFSGTGGREVFKGDTAMSERVQESLKRILMTKEKIIKEMEGKLQQSAMVEGEVRRLKGLIYEVFGAAMFEYEYANGDLSAVLSALSADLAQFIPFIRRVLPSDQDFQALQAELSRVQIAMQALDKREASLLAKLDVRDTEVVRLRSMNSALQEELELCSRTVRA